MERVSTKKQSKKIYLEERKKIQKYLEDIFENNEIAQSFLTLERISKINVR